MKKETCSRLIFSLMSSLLLCGTRVLAFTTARAATGHRLETAPSTAAAAVSASASLSLSATATPRTFDFQGHQIYSEVTTPEETVQSKLLGPSKPAVVLIHGFGCSTVYWRETAKALSEAGYTVHALDLLGQGKSAKPGRSNGIEYSIDLWAQLVDNYAQQFIPDRQGVIVMGNSLGSVVALSVATGDFSKISSTDTSSRETYVRDRLLGIGLYNCGVGMNSRNLLKDPSLSKFLLAIFTALFDLLDSLIFNNIPVLTYVLTKLVTKDLLQNALLGLYQCAEDPESRVDDVLVDSFFYPSQDGGSIEALNQIYTNDAGPTPMELHRRYADILDNVPIHLIWGDQDNVTPLSGSVGQFYLDLSNKESSNVSIDVIQAGHVPFDEIPECNYGMVQWLEGKVVPSKRQPFFSAGVPLPFGQ